MKVKLDQNVDVRLASLVAGGGHQVDTVRSEGLSGRSDEAIYEACRSSGRTLITLDLDFSNPLRFPPAPTEGIIVLRPARAVLPQIRSAVLGLLPELRSRSPQGMLWIVEQGRIRVYDPRGESSPT